MNLTDEQTELLAAVAAAYEDGHRSEFIFVRTHDGSSVLFNDNFCIPVAAGILDFKRLAAGGLIDFDSSPKDPTGKITGDGLAAYRATKLTNGARAESQMEDPDPKSVFVVHGRDENIRQSMFSFLRALKLNPMEWSQAVKKTGEGSPYVGRVLDVAFGEAKAIVVLFTPDEEVRLREGLQEGKREATSHQARPNVLFEAGMAMGRCPKRTLLVEIGEIRPFSDIGGRHVLRFDGSTEQRKELAQRLETAGCEVDTTGNDWLSVGSFETTAPTEATDSSDEGRFEEIDRTDALNRLEGWMKNRPYEDNLKTITFEDVDLELNLPPGTASEFLAEIGQDSGYKVRRQGPTTILFERPPHIKTGQSRWSS